MRFSFNWLKKHLRTDLSLEQIADKLNSIGVEVEEVLDPQKMFDKFKLVQIESVNDHSDATKLHICGVVDAEGNRANIVCGAANVRVGLKTILAMEGAIIPGTGDKLKKSKIRGVVSEGMMCSHQELGLPSKEDGIIDLDPKIELSASVGDALNFDDGIIDVSITPNRGDCFSVKGIARDLAAAGAGEFLNQSVVPCKTNFNFSMPIKLKDAESLSEYLPKLSFRLIKNVRNGESPQWLKSALNVAGINSISLIVDLANWHMLDSGQPMHIYDADKISGNFSVRLAKNSERFMDLKGEEHTLTGNILVSADDDDVLCVMGIMGSQKAACTMETKNILIESALFSPELISRTGNFLGITSDSRTRFERGVDRNAVFSSLNEITKSIVKNCGGEVSEIFTVKDRSQKLNSVKLSHEKLNRICGTEIDWKQALKILADLGFKNVENFDDELEEKAEFKIPSWRSDISIEADLIEEILRIYGYDKIPEQKVESYRVADNRTMRNKKQETAIARLLTSRGLSEIVSYSFTKKKYAEVFDEGKSLIHLMNPISTDLSVMRPSLIPCLVNSAARSLNFGEKSAKIFETGHVFFDDCVQQTHISGVRIGEFEEDNWLQKSRDTDVFDVKADALAVLDFCGAEEVITELSAPSYYHPFRSGTLKFGSKILGYFGELHPKINKLFDINKRIVCFELLFDKLHFENKKSSMVTKIFPSIERDYAFLFKVDAPVGSTIENIYKLDKRIVKVRVFDNFSVNNSTKSIGISVALNAGDRTMTESEAVEISEKIIKYVSEKGGMLRSR